MNKSKLIQLIASASKTNEHELLLEFMDEYGLNCLQDASEEQLELFIEERVIKNGNYTKTFQRGFGTNAKSSLGCKN